jgi:hypothetical protein
LEKREEFERCARFAIQTALAVRAGRPYNRVMNIRAGAVIVMLAAAIGGAVWLATRTSPRTPAPTSRASSGESYVGNQTCARCHPEEAFRHARSGHARTLARSADSAAARALDGTIFDDEERGVTFHYRLTGEELAVSVPEKLGDDRFPLDWAFGSGEHAITFLTLIPNQAGETVGIEHRVSLFGREHHAGLTPSHAGLEPGQSVEWFGRVMRGERLAACIGCHTTTSEIEWEGKAKFTANIGCERCHGPGGNHVREAETQEQVSALPLGGGATSAEDQIRVCGECHRHPDRLHETKVAVDNPRLARFQPVGLMQSACFRKSSGRMSCTTCHDPHEHAPREREQFDGRCLACHGTGQSLSPRCPVSPSENCIACHMPEIEVRPGTKFHDHWIRIRDSGQPPVDDGPEDH